MPLVGRSHLPFAFVLAFLVAAPPTARADTPAAADVTTVSDCLRKADKTGGSQEGDEAACVMTIAKPCA